MRTVAIKVLKDGSHRVRIHYFVRDPSGPIQTQRSVHRTVRGPYALGGAKGYIACNKAQTTVVPQVSKGTIHPTCHSDDARAVTCPECKESEAYKSSMEGYSELLETARASSQASSQERRLRQET